MPGKKRGVAEDDPIQSERFRGAVRALAESGNLDDAVGEQGLLAVLTQSPNQSHEAGDVPTGEDQRTR